MPNRPSPGERAAAVRNQAKRARRLADGLPEGNDRVRMLEHAEELEREAEALEAEASGNAPTRRHGQREQQQTQEQQQQGEEPTESKPKS